MFEPKNINKECTTKCDENVKCYKYIRVCVYDNKRARSTCNSPERQRSAFHV